MPSTTSNRPRWLIGRYAVKAGVGGVGRVGGGVGAVEKRVGLWLHHLAVFAGDLQRIGCGDERARRIRARVSSEKSSRAYTPSLATAVAVRRFAIGVQVVERGFACRVVTGSTPAAARPHRALRSHEGAPVAGAGHERCAPVKCMMMAGHRAPFLAEFLGSTAMERAIDTRIETAKTSAGTRFSRSSPIAFAMLSTIEAGRKTGRTHEQKPPSTALAHAQARSSRPRRCPGVRAAPLASSAGSTTRPPQFGYVGAPANGGRDRFDAAVAGLMQAQGGVDRPRRYDNAHRVLQAAGHERCCRAAGERGMRRVLLSPSFSASPVEHVIMMLAGCSRQPGATRSCWATCTSSRTARS